MKKILISTSFILLLTGCNLIYIGEQDFLKRGGEMRTCEGNYPSVEEYSDSSVLKLSHE